MEAKIELWDGNPGTLNTTNQTNFTTIQKLIDQINKLSQTNPLFSEYDVSFDVQLLPLLNRNARVQFLNNARLLDELMPDLMDDILLMAGIIDYELKNGTIDLLWNGYSVTPQRQKKVAFSRVYLLNKQVLVTKKKDRIQNFQDMTGKTLGVQNGSTGMTMLDEYPKLLKDRIKNHKAVLYDTFPNAFIDLNANRIQGILMDEVYANYYIQHQSNKDAYATYSSSKMPADKFAVGMRKGDKTLRRKVNQGLGHLQKTGELRKINQKWFGTNSNYLGPNN